MGVGGNFWDLLKPYARHEGVDFLRDKRVAVDLSFWIVQQQAAVKAAVRNPHLRLTFFRTINMFSKFGAFPVFIVDGCPSPLKSQARIARYFHGSGVDLLSSPKRNEISAERSQVFRTRVQECVELLQYLGMPVLTAKGEAEALCAQLNREGHVDACITADSDAFLYGAKCVIKCIQPKSNEPFECYHMSDIEAGLHLKRKQLIAISLLVGSDLDLNGVQGIGLDTAVRFVQNVDDNEVLDRLREVHQGDGVPAIIGDSSVDGYSLGSSSGVMNKKSEHCSLCGHPGSKRLHLKSACEYCMTKNGGGCTRKSSGFKCFCTSCDMDRRKKDSERQRSWWVKVCRKISSEPNFPNADIIEMYLTNDHGHFDVNGGPNMLWKSPNTDMVVDFLSYHLFWQPSSIRLKMIPLLSTIFLREMASNPTESLLNGQFEFDGIARVKIRCGHPYYLVKWKRACISSSTLDDSGAKLAEVIQIDESVELFEDDSFSQVVNVGNGSPFLLTDENMELVRAAFPDEVRSFLQAQERGHIKKASPGCSKPEVAECSGVQLSIKNFYRSTKPKAPSPEKKRTALSPVVSKSVRRRLFF